MHSLKPTTYLIRRAQSLLPPGSDAAPGFEPPPHSTAPVLVEEPAPQTQALPPRRRWWEDRAPEAMYAAAQLTVAESLYTQIVCVTTATEQSAPHAPGCARCSCVR